MTVVETGSSANIFAGVLSELDEDGLLHPIAFFSKKHLARGVNHGMYDGELLATMGRSLRTMAPELECPGPAIKVLSHEASDERMTTKQLSRRQARRSRYSSSSSFVVTYRKANSSPHRRIDQKELGDFCLRQMCYECSIQTLQQQISKV